MLLCSCCLTFFVCSTLKRELPRAGLVQVGVVNRSNLPCEVVGKGREKLLEDFAKHVLSGITIWQQYNLQNQQITAFLFALLYIQLHGLLQSLSEVHTFEQHSNLHCSQCANQLLFKDLPPP